MGRDKKTDRFNHSPFKTLKGLPVSGRQPLPAAPPEPEPAVEAVDDHDLFIREMAWRDVRPLQGENRGRDGKVTPVPSAAPSDTGVEAAEFLAAIGRLDKTFRDEIPTVEEAPRARPRRMKQLERGELKPAAELDLHGLTRDEAVARTRAFLGHAARQGWAALVIVTGKGLHSAEGPVLRRAVEQLLDRSRDVVLEWGEAPRRFGGAGALVVFVRRAGRED